jgi:hypothetical protein
MTARVRAAWHYSARRTPGVAQGRDQTKIRHRWSREADRTKAQAPPEANRWPGVILRSPRRHLAVPQPPMSWIGRTIDL